MAAINPSSWRDRAIERSEGITDAWEVSKVFLGRIAEWVLFACMIANIIEMLPGVALAGWLSNTIMGVQVVMLDVGGFSLASMADQARDNGEQDAANKARATGYLLIAIMIVTLLLVSVGILWPALRNVTVGAEKGLILVRVVMTVIYGHVLHSLRRKSLAPIQPQQANQDVEELRSEIGRLSEQVMNLQAAKSETAVEPVSINETGLHLVPSVSSDASEFDPVALTTIETEIETTKPTETASERASRILKRHPNLTATQLAAKASITPQYAGKLLKKQAHG